MGHSAVHSDNPLCCPVVETLRLLGGKWKPMLIHQLLEAPQQFGQLQRRLSPISHKVLTEQLRELESAGLVARDVGEERVVTVTYQLTESGQALRPVLDSMFAWADVFLAEADSTV